MSDGPSIVNLADRRLDPVPDVVALLEALLEGARAGEIRGIAVAIACDDRHTGSAVEIGDGTIADLYLAIDRVKLRMLDLR